MHCVLRKTLCTTLSVSERADVDSANECGDPEHQIALCEVNSIKSDNNHGYIINRFITKFIPNEPANFGNTRKLAPRNKTDSTVNLL